MQADKTTQEHRQEGRGRKVFWSLVLVGSTVALLGFVHGPNRGHFGPRQSHRQLGHISPEQLQEKLAHAADHLDLTEEQAREVSRLVESRVSILQALESDGDELMADFAAAIQSETSDADDFQELRASALALAEAAVGESIDLIAELTQLLTPAQRQELLRHWRQG